MGEYTHPLPDAKKDGHIRHFMSPKHSAGNLTSIPTYGIKNCGGVCLIPRSSAPILSLIVTSRRRIP